LASAIAADLDDTIFIFDTNIIEDDDVHLVIEYHTEARGRFYGAYTKAAYKLAVLPTETTVEHLVDYVANKYSTALNDAGVEMVLMSEGLSKGACVTTSPT
jgi:hypothetical protein